MSPRSSLCTPAPRAPPSASPPTGCTYTHEPESGETSISGFWSFPIRVHSDRCNRWNFFVVMITPVIINRLQWKAYLIFMCLNFAFVPLVYFCYPETANLTLEEIDFIFADHTKSTVKVSKELCRERMKYRGARRESLVEQFHSDERERRRSKGGGSQGTAVAEHEEEKIV
jgi:hypothetical protein